MAFVCGPKNNNEITREKHHLLKFIYKFSNFQKKYVHGPSISDLWQTTHMYLRQLTCCGRNTCRRLCHNFFVSDALVLVGLKYVEYYYFYFATSHHWSSQCAVFNSINLLLQSSVDLRNPNRYIHTIQLRNELKFIHTIYVIDARRRWKMYVRRVPFLPLH